MNIIPKRIASLICGFAAVLLVGANYGLPAIFMSSLSPEANDVFVAAHLSDAGVSSLGGVKKCFTNSLFYRLTTRFDWLTSLVPDPARGRTISWSFAPSSRPAMSILHCRFNL